MENPSINRWLGVPLWRAGNHQIDKSSQPVTVDFKHSGWLGKRLEFFRAPRPEERELYNKGLPVENFPLALAPARALIASAQTPSDFIRLPPLVRSRPRAKRVINHDFNFIHGLLKATCTIWEHRSSSELVVWLLDLEASNRGAEAGKLPSPVGKSLLSGWSVKSSHDCNPITSLENGSRTDGKWCKSQLRF